MYTCIVKVGNLTDYPFGVSLKSAMACVSLKKRYKAKTNYIIYKYIVASYIYIYATN